MFQMVHGCGCCYYDFDITAEEALRIHLWIWKDRNLGSSLDIEYVDINGDKCVAEGIDTFYGIWSDDEEKVGSLQRLLDNYVRLLEESKNSSKEEAP